MQIFESEINDGIADLVKSSASITYAAIAEPSAEKEPSLKCMIKSQAAIEDSDLYYVQSILVSSSWNKNDDIFDKAEVWAAKNSPEDKPTNLEHNENYIIGHITSNWPIDDDGNKINPDLPIESLPEKYHIVTGSVIYRGYTDPILRERSEQLIKDIESGKKFVSMECFFKGFDYGLLNTANGQYSILPRNDKTSHLTKFLRAYGGAGQHENYKIGRVLRNITFSGKGFVDKPANPDSIIFSHSCINHKKNDSFEELGVLFDKSTCITETIDMNSEAENIVVEQEAVASTENVDTPVTTETVAEVETVETTEQPTEAAMPVKSEDDMEDKKEEVMKMLEEKAMKMAEEKAMKMMEEKAMKMTEEAALMKAEYESKWKAAIAELEAVKAELVASQAEVSEFKTKEAKAQQEAKKNHRIATLTQLGVDSEVAVSTVEKLEHVDDSTFEAMTSVFAKQTTETVENTTEAEVAAEPAPTAAEILDSVEPEDSVDLSIGSEQVPAIETTRAELLDFVCARLGKKLNKGE